MDDLTGGTRREERVTGRPDATIHDPDDTIGGVAGGAGSGTGERATGTPNTIYDLSSVLFHALEGGASYDTYVEDAEREGDGELADFFRRVRDEDSMRADEAQRLLAERSPTATASAAGRGMDVEPIEGATAPSEGFAAGAPRREETFDVVEGRAAMEDAPTTPGTGGVGRVESDVGDRTEPSLAREGTEEGSPPRTSGIEEGVLPGREGRTEGTPPREGALRGDMSPEDTSRRAEDEGPLGREGAGRQEGDREEDKGLLDRAKDAILGEEDEPRRREGSDRPGERR
jgi:rubrerythrin